MGIAEIRIEVLRLTYRKDQSPEENTATADKLVEWAIKDADLTVKAPARRRAKDEDKGAGTDPSL